MNKRKILSLALAVCLIALFTMGTLAYFTDSAATSNKFMTASYDPSNPDKVITAEELFSIKVYETDANGQKDYDGLTYEDIAPGDELDKDPTAENTGKYGQYVRMSVTLTKASAWQNAVAQGTDLTTIFKGFDSTKWTRYDEPAVDTTNDTVTYVFYYNGILAPGGTATLFTDVVIPTSLTVDDMVALSQFEINITADAIQSDNTGDNAYDAFKKW